MGWPPPKSPMDYRLFVWSVSMTRSQRILAATLAAVVTLGCLPVTALCQPAAGPQTAEDSVRRALDHPSVKDVMDARIRAVRAEIREHTTFPVPSFALEHEQVLDELEFAAVVEQAFDLSGWRGRLAEAGPYRESALRSELDVWRLDVAVAVRTAFYSVRYREERVRLLDAWIARLEKGLTTIEARRKRGDATTYSVRRIERELEIGKAQRATEASALAEAWGELEAWTHWDTRPPLKGDLEPAAASDAPSPKTTDALPQLLRLQHLELALDAEIDAWGSPFWRGWTVGAGYRYVESGAETGHGFLVSLSIPHCPLEHRPTLDRAASRRARSGQRRAAVAPHLCRARRGSGAGAAGPGSGNPGVAVQPRTRRRAYQTCPDRICCGRSHAD